MTEVETQTRAGLSDTRRRFLKTSGLTALGMMLGTTVRLDGNLAAGFVTQAHAQDSGFDLMQDKKELLVLGDRPLNAETPAHLLDDEITPYERLFVRMNGLVPQTALDQDAEGWMLTIDGEVENPLSLTIADLKSQFENVTRRLVIECGGNGRAFFQPGTSGNQWTMGAVGCPEWTGVRLADVLRAAGVKPSAVYTGHYGNDVHLNGDDQKEVISRGVPIKKAMEDDAIIAWAMNGAPLSALHGFPLRLIVPGYPASVSQKYLNRIRLRDKEHDGAKMTGDSYRIPAYPIVPGTEVPDEDMIILEAMPVKSLITFPQTGAEVKAGDATEIRGHAWCGKGDVAAVHVSLDYGQSWQKADLQPAANRFAWQRWHTELTMPQHGYYEVWVRATDRDGISQPPLSPAWNPRGYANNIQHRIALAALA